MSSRSRSRSRSPAARNQSWYDGKRTVREESMSPVRTASGAGLYGSKYSGNRGVSYRGGNYNRNYNNYQQRYNNRGYYNRGNYRWNRGRGNYRGGQQYYRNNWNQGRRRYNSRNEYDRSRSRSYDRRSRSRSYSRSRSRDSRSRSRDSYDKRSRSRSFHRKSSSDRSHSRSRSRSPRPINTEAWSAVKNVKPREKSRSPDPPPPGEESPVKILFAGKDDSLPSKSRWETPESSPNRTKRQKQENKSGAKKEVQQDEIFDNWDDDKLRAYLLKTKVQKIEIKPLVDINTGAKNVPVVPEKKKTRKKSRPKSSHEPADDPHDAEAKKEGRGRKKKRSVKPCRSSSSSSSSWSPIHKAPAVDTNNQRSSAKEENVSQQFKTFPQSYGQPQLYSQSEAGMQTVQYPFSHMQKTTIPSMPTPSNVVQPPATTAPTGVQYPKPVPPPNPMPAAASGLSDVKIIGPDGTPIQLVQVTVPGPDGKPMQVMQIQPATNISMPATKSQPVYRKPPPPPAYPPPAMSNFTQSPASTVTTAISNQEQLERKFVPIGYEESSNGTEKRSVPSLRSDHNVQLMYPTQDDKKQVDVTEKQKRRKEVLRTRLWPRPASSNWSQESTEDKITSDKSEEKQQARISEKRNIKESNKIPGFGFTDISGKHKTEEGRKIKDGGRIPGLSPDRNSGRQSGEGLPIMTINQSKTETQKKNPPVDERVVSQRDYGIKSMTAEGSQLQMTSQVVQQTATQAYNVKPSNAKASFTQIPPQLAEHGFKAVLGNPHLLVGPNGEMLQLIAAPPVSQPKITEAPQQVLPVKNADDNWKRAAEDFIRDKQETYRQGHSSTVSDSQELSSKSTKRMRNVSEGSDRGLKKKDRSVTPEEDVVDEVDDSTSPKQKKESKKKKKKNKKKKDAMEEDEEGSTKGRKKKKKDKSKKESESPSLRDETIKSKKELKVFQKAIEKSKDDNLIRSVSKDLPLSHIRSIVPRRKEEGSKPVFVGIDFEVVKRSGLASSSSYEDRFVSLFGTGDADCREADDERVDITKKSVRKFKVHLQGTRAVMHMTQISLSDRVKTLSNKKDANASAQKVSLNVSSLSKLSVTYDSSSASSPSPEKSRPVKSKSKSRSRSRSLSLPLAYSTDDKSTRRQVLPPQRSPYRQRSGSRDSCGKEDDLRHSLDKKRSERRDSRSRSRSRSYSSGDERDGGRYKGQWRQQYNYKQYGYNQRGRGQYRGNYNYYGRRGYNSNYRGRGNYRGRYQHNNWNQGYRNQNRYQRYDNRSDDRYNERDVSPLRSRDRSYSRERDDYNRKDNLNGSADEKHETSTLFQEKNYEEAIAQNSGGNTSAGGDKQLDKGIERKKSPAQWTHDMFEQHEMEQSENGK